MVGRGQAYTLEGVLAAILVVTATVFGLQAIDTRAWEDATRGETEELQDRASDTLQLATNTGAMRDAVLCYSEGRLVDGDRAQPRATFESMLNTTFDRQADQYNLYFTYRNDTDDRERLLVSETSSGGDKRPPTSAAVATTTVTVTNDMRTRQGDSCDPIPISVENNSGFYIQEDVSEDGPLYNIVEVRLVVW